MKLPRFLSFLFVIAFTSVVATGCMKSGTTPQDGGPSYKPSNEEDERDDAAGLPRLRMYMSDQSVEVPVRVQLYERHINERNGISLEVAYIPHAQYLEQLNLRFAGGDFPDVYQAWSGPTPELIYGDKILPLNDLIDRHGPNLKRVIPQAAWDSVTVDGNIYAIPQPSETLQGSVLYIRKDWLDKLKLDIPETSDELLQVMRAFRDGDPNGNGLPDEIPFIMREKLEWGENLFGMWGVNSRYTEVYDNEELIFGSVHPRFVNALGYLQTMYKEQLLDPDFLMNTLSIWDQKIKAGLVGIWCHTPRSAWKWQQALESSIPEQNPEVIVIPTPQGADYSGAVGARWGTIGKTYIVMKDAQDPEAIIEYFDWLLSDEGRQFTEKGIEGETYYYNGDKIVYSEEHAHEVDFLQKVYAAHGLSAEAEAAILNDERATEKLAAAFEVANSQGFVSETIGMPSIENDYNLHSLFVEEAAMVIIGMKPPEAYADFIATWRRNGGQAFIDERTEWYRSNRQ